MPQIADYLERFRDGDADGAFHGLLELDHELLPELEAEFRVATDTRLRVFLLSVSWQHRQQSVIPLLAEAMLDSEPQVWREALDGLVTLASPASLEALHAARTRQFAEKRDAEEFRRWLEEAIEQTETETQGLCPGGLTMRLSEPGHRVTVATVASHGPGRCAWVVQRGGPIHQSIW